MRLIDADTLRDEVLHDTTHPNEIVNYYLYAIDYAPTIDAVPVVRGEWIQHHETTTDNETLPYGWECSLCGRWEMEKQPFCNCGAKMEDKP